MKTSNLRFRFKPIWFLWLLTVPLLIWSLRSTPLSAIQREIFNLQGSQIFLLLALNGLILVIISTRWWLLLRAMGFHVAFAHVFSYRLTSFGVSYFTPGPQFGGEPAQIALLTRKDGIASAPAVSSVYLDKLLELMVNFLVLAGGLILTLATGLRNNLLQHWLWLPAVGVMLLPGVHLLALWRGRLPFSALLNHLGFSRLPRPFFQRIFATINEAELQIALFLRRKPDVLIAGITLSILSWMGMIMEYALMARFLGIEAPFFQVLFAFVLSRLAFLAPLPGGLGVLEASQVLAMQILGFGAVTGVALSLLMRARDILIGLTGIVLGGFSLYQLSNLQTDRPIQTLKE